MELLFAAFNCLRPVYSFAMGEVARGLIMELAACWGDAGDFCC